MAKSSLIAVIDDDEGMRTSLDGLLRSLGHHTALYASAEAFLACDTASRSACVISDISMEAGMSGLELARQLVNERPALPVILMTGFRQPGCAEEASRCGVVRLLPKPFDEQTLIDCIDEALAV